MALIEISSINTIYYTTLILYIVFLQNANKISFVISTFITTKELLYNLTYYFIRTFLNSYSLTEPPTTDTLRVLESQVFLHYLINKKENYFKF